MKISFRPLLTVEVSHSYYAGRCRDFGFVTPPDTLGVLRGGRLLAREVEGVLHVLYEADAAGAPVANLGGATLRIGLQLLNPYFENYTQLPPDFPTRKLCYSNAADPRALGSETAVVLVGDHFTHQLSDDARPVTVTLQDADGVMETLTVEEGDERESVSFDLHDQPNGRFTLKEVFPTVTRVVECYRDPGLERLDAAGVLDITLSNDFYADPAAFEIAFQAAEEVLRYYVVARNYSASDLNHLRVSDVGFTEDGRDEVEFDKVAAAAFTPAELPAALIAESGERVVMFRSAAPLARRERARRRIQLSKSGDVLIANLPQPGADRARAELIVHLSKP